MCQVCMCCFSPAFSPFFRVVVLPCLMVRRQQEAEKYQRNCQICLSSTCKQFAQYTCRVTSGAGIGGGCWAESATRLEREMSSPTQPARVHCITLHCNLTTGQCILNPKHIPLHPLLLHNAISAHHLFNCTAHTRCNVTIYFHCTLGPANDATQSAQIHASTSTHPPKTACHRKHNVLLQLCLVDCKMVQ